MLLPSASKLISREALSSKASIFKTIKALVLVVFISANFEAQAQIPDAGALQQQLQREIDRSRPQFLSDDIKPRKEENPTKQKADGQKILVKSFVVTGMTLITDSDAQAALKNYTDRELTLDQIRDAANAVAALAVRVCGGQSMLKHMPLERMYRDSRLGSTMLPWSAEVALERIGKAGLYDE